MLDEKIRCCRPDTVLRSFELLNRELEDMLLRERPLIYNSITNDSDQVAMVILGFRDFLQRRRTIRKVGFHQIHQSNVTH